MKRPRGYSRESLRPGPRGPFGWIICFFLLIVIQSPLLAKPLAYPEDTLLFREGEVLLAKGETEKALLRFKKLVTDFPESSLRNEAKFRMGMCYTQLKRPKEALRVLNELLSTFLTPERMVQIFTLLGDNHIELKDRLNALHDYGKGLLKSRTNEELKRKIRTIIDTYDSEEELNQIESSYRGAYGGAYAKLRLAFLAKGRGNDLLARKLLIELEKDYHGLSEWPQARELFASVSPKPKYTVGVILPLSGIQQPFGERALRAIQLAMKESEPENIPLVSLVVRDTKGNPSEAEKAIEELVNKEKVIAIIGPLLSVTVDSAAQKAQQLKVPLLTLSQKELSSVDADFIFQNSITPLGQTQTLVGFAVQQLGLRTFSVFYPNSPYGLHFKNLFSQEVARQGGRVSGIFLYQEDQTDFTQEIKQLAKIHSGSRFDDRIKKNQPPNLLVDGLFIPDTHDRVGLILSQMTSARMKGVTLLGTSAANGPNLLSVSAKQPGAAFFVDAFSKKDPSPQISQFVKEFQKTYQKDPETLEAISYDGARLLRETLRSKPVSSPRQLKEELRQVQDFQGVSGLKGFGEDGRPIRTLSIFKVSKGQIEKVPEP